MDDSELILLDDSKLISNGFIYFFIDTPIVVRCITPMTVN